MPSRAGSRGLAMDTRRVANATGGESVGWTVWNRLPWVVVPGQHLAHPYE